MVDHASMQPAPDLRVNVLFVVMRLPFVLVVLVFAHSEALPPSTLIAPLQQINHMKRCRI